jgi:hypothetical protein
MDFIHNLQDAIFQPARTPAQTWMGVLGVVAFFVVGIFIMKTLSPKLRRRAVAIGTFLAGSILLVEYFVPVRDFKPGPAAVVVVFPFAAEDTVSSAITSGAAAALLESFSDWPGLTTVSFVRGTKEVEEALRKGLLTEADLKGSYDYARALALAEKLNARFFTVAALRNYKLDGTAKTAEVTVVGQFCSTEAGGRVLREATRLGTARDLGITEVVPDNGDGIKRKRRRPMTDEEIGIAAATDGITRLTAAIAPLKQINDPQANFLTNSVEPVGVFFQVVWAFSLGLGTVNLVMVHGSRLAKKHKDWLYSLTLLVAIPLMIIVTVWYNKTANDLSLQMMTPKQVSAAGFTGKIHQAYNVLFTGLYTPMKATMFALLGFFIVSAGYRAFRLRSLEASILMITAIIVMLGQMPLLSYVTAWIPSDSAFGSFRVEELRAWLSSNLGGGAMRAMQFGVWVGALAAGLRLWLSLDRLGTGGES